MPGRTVVQWDKDDLDALGILKVDCLALGMLSAIRRSLDLLREHTGQSLTLATIPGGRPRCLRDDSAGRHGRCFPDRIARSDEHAAAAEAEEVLRPGRSRWRLSALVRSRGRWSTRTCGDATARRPVEYPSEAVREVLNKTLGVPLFQEQAMKLVVVAAGFTPGEADQLRRAMGAWKRNGRHQPIRAEVDRRHAGQRLHRGIRPQPFRADRRLRLVWLPGIACGVVRTACLCLGVDQMPSSRGFPGRPLEQPADGFLRTGATGGRRSPAWCRGPSG